MISLKKHVEQAEAERILLRELETSYADALENIADCILPVSEDLADGHRKEVRRMLKEMSGGLTVPLLTGIRTRLKDLMRTYLQQGSAMLEARNREVKRILHVFAEALSTLAEQGRADDGRLGGFTRNLESIIEMNDLPEVRKRLAQEVTDLKQAVQEMRQRNQQSLEELQHRVQTFEEKLSQTERMAHTDPLTQLRNRRFGEDEVSAFIGRRQAFCVLLLDLNGFKGINDRWGHQAGDAMLIQFTRRLRCAVRGIDTVCRWGGDEFLVILPGCDLAQAAKRSEQVARACNGEYELNVMGNTIKVRRSAAQGLADYRPGEPLELLLRRADECMYKAKGRELPAADREPGRAVRAGYRTQDRIVSGL